MGQCTAKCVWVDELQQEAIMIAYDPMDNYYTIPTEFSTNLVINYIFPDLCGNVYIAPKDTIASRLCYRLSMDDTVKDLMNMMDRPSGREMICLEAAVVCRYIPEYTDISIVFVG